MQFLNYDNHPHGRNILLISSLLYIQVEPFPFKTINPCPVAAGPAEKFIPRSFLYTPSKPERLQYRPPQNLLLSRLNNSNSVTLSLQQSCLIPPDINGPHPDPLYQVHVFSVLGTLELDIAGENHLPWSSGHTYCDAGQNKFGFLDFRCTQLAHVQFLTHQQLQVRCRKILEVDVKATLFLWDTHIFNESRIWPKKGNKGNELLFSQHYMNRPVRIRQCLLGINKYKLSKQDK